MTKIQISKSQKGQTLLFEFHFWVIRICFEIRISSFDILACAPIYFSIAG